MTPTVSINFYDPDVIADPWPYFGQVAAKGPVVYNEALDVWHVHRHSDVTKCFSDSRRFSSTVQKKLSPNLGTSMINVDPPEHERLRGPLQTAFTKRLLSDWTVRIEAIVDELFGRFVTTLRDRGHADVVEDFIWHIPSMVIAEMMGIPAERRGDFHQWSLDFVAGVGAQADPTPTGQDKAARAKRASTELHDFLGEQLQRRRPDEGDDLLARALAANSHGEMSDEEMAETAVLLLVAGNDTTAKLIAHCVVKLAEFPEQRVLLTRDPALIPNAIEEILRYEQLSLSIPREVVGGSAEVAGEEIPDGAVVWMMTGMANRDPEVFPNGDVIDVRRGRTAPHLGFGYGTHLCLGANLARTEVRTALERLLAEYPDYEVASYELGRSWSVRGPVHIDFASGSTRKEFLRHCI